MSSKYHILLPSRHYYCPYARADLLSSVNFPECLKDTGETILTESHEFGVFEYMPPRKADSREMASILSVPGVSIASPWRPPFGEGQ